MGCCWVAGGHVSNFSSFLIRSLSQRMWHKVWKTLSGHKELDCMGFTGVLHSVGADADSAAFEALNKIEDAKAESAFAIAHQLVTHRAMSMSRFSRCCPGMFALLLAKNAPHRASGLALCVEAWETIDVADRHSLLDSGVRALVQSVVWTGEVFVRGVLMILAQHRFTMAPLHVLPCWKCTSKHSAKPPS